MLPYDVLTWIPAVGIVLPIVITIAIAAWLNNKRLDDLRADIGRLETRLRAEMDDFREEMRNAIREIRADIREIKTAVQDLDRRVTIIEERSRPKILT